MIGFGQEWRWHWFLTVVQQQTRRRRRSPSLSGSCAGIQRHISYEEELL
jgi:hypothetical protein